jgi:hypothetical protein
MRSIWLPEVAMKVNVWLLKRDLEVDEGEDLARYEPS